MKERQVSRGDASVPTQHQLHPRPYADNVIETGGCICAALLVRCTHSLQLCCFSRVNPPLFYTLPCHHPPSFVLTRWTGSCFIALACGPGGADSCSVFGRFILCSYLL